MAKLDDAPLVELIDVFDEEDFVGPPDEALKPKPPVQSDSAPARSTRSQRRTRPSTPPDQAERAILYTPTHPANQKSPTRRGRPPKKALHNCFAAPPPPLPQLAYHVPRARLPQQRLARPSHQTPNIIQSNRPSTSLIQPGWVPQQTRFGGLPNFHTSLINGINPPQPVARAPNFATMLSDAIQTSSNQQQAAPSTSSAAPSTTNSYPPRMPNILSNTGPTVQPAQPAHRVYKPPSERAAINRTGSTLLTPAHAQQPLVQPPAPTQVKTYHRNARTNSYQFVPRAAPVRSAQEDLMRQISSMDPALNINNLLQRLLSNQCPAQNEPVDQEAVKQIKRQLEESLMSFNPHDNITSVNNPQMMPPQALYSHNNFYHIPPEPKKLPPTEDDISKQDQDAEAHQDEEYHEAETYSDYVPSKLTIGRPHPDPVVETSSLATVEPPDITYVLRLPKTVIDNCLLSALQLESVVYASQQHEQLLADGKTRRGFLIGDGAGVGKGRTIAGIIYENYLAGRRKSVWLSVSPDLKFDAERDLRDIGAKQIPVHSMTKVSYGRKIDAPHGVIFSTYTGLVSRSQSVKGVLGTRLGQLVSWLGPNFDGVIVFDECHKAKNISVTAKKKQSKTADFALEFQKKLPGARVVYASATGASETRHLGYMTRLGLWGEGTPYEEFSDFCSAIEKRGVGAMELVAVDLKMRGSYMARQLSFKTTSFDIKIAELDEKFVALYDRCVDLWANALQKFVEACAFFGSNGKTTRRIWMCFWAAHQKFFKYLCIGAKVPLVVQIAKEALADGKCVVIGLQSTGEAKTMEALEDGDINEFISTAKATFESLIDNHFPAPRRSRVSPKLTPQPVEQPDTQGSSTDLSSVTLIDETFHSHEVVKFCAENGLASAELEDFKAEQELKQSTSKVNSSKHEELKRRKLALEDLARELREAPKKSDRALRARKRAKTRSTRNSRIRKVIDDSETEVSTPTSSSNSGLTMPSPESSTDETYSEGESSDSTLKDVTEEDEKPAVKRSRKSPAPKAEILKSDSDSDIEITAVKPRSHRAEIIFLSSDEDEDDEGSTDPDDPMVAHGEKLSAMRDELLAMINDIGPSLPHNTLDDLIDQLGGPDRVAEMTGRKGRVVKDEDGLISYKQRNEADALDCLNIAEKERFMKGDKLVAIISEAASSGISLQADRRAGNQFRRVHITIELPWSADRAIQQFGRTHRSNQISGPEYVFVISELSGEKRFASVVAKRLESLGALTHGDRRATTESRDLSQFNLSGRFCRQALEQIQRYVEFRQNDMGISPQYSGNFLVDARQAFLDSGLATKRLGDRFCIEPAMLNVNHFLNRLLGMKVRIQNSLFKLFTDYMDKLIARKKISGQYDAGILELNSESGKTTCFPPEDFFLKTRAGTVKCTLRNVQVERGIPWQEAKKLYEENLNQTQDTRSGFYIYQGPGASQIISLLLREPSSVDLFRSFKPNTGRAPKAELFAVLHKGRKYSLTEAEALWSRIYEFTSEKCVHLCYFNLCKRREAKMSCDVGLRHRYYCILSGGILTAWPYLERKSAEVTEKVRIVRLRLDANNRVIGPIIPQPYVDRVRKILSEGAKETVVF